MWKTVSTSLFVTLSVVSSSAHRSQRPLAVVHGRTHRHARRVSRLLPRSRAVGAVARLCAATRVSGHTELRARERERGAALKAAARAADAAVGAGHSGRLGYGCKGMGATVAGKRKHSDILHILVISPLTSRVHVGHDYLGNDLILTFVLFSLGVGFCFCFPLFTHALRQHSLPRCCRTWSPSSRRC